MYEFEYEELEAATQNFSATNLTGKGSHGSVYKGVLSDGRIVAIKKQSLGLQKLQDNSKLDNEVRILSTLSKTCSNLINVVGISHDSFSNKVLVMEYLPNGTLHDLLHFAPTPPTWPKRIEIAVQVARAVQFLHDTKPLVIHRDIKTSNILFDALWNAKLADFGLAIEMTTDSSSQRVDSVSRPAGTIGYLDPCYTTPKKLSAKNDVFSFGVVLLEIISCTKAIDVNRVPATIVHWAMLLIQENRILDICDKRVALPRYMEPMILHVVNIALRCISAKPYNRPTISEIVTDVQNCLVEPTRFPIWITSFFPGIFFLLKKRRKIGTRRYKTTTTIVCAAHEASKQVDISGKKLLLREILADAALS
ncbi:serine/threonine-protein kinase-like protein [Heracleum sosnowskyi]|uniref:Serine/threonine-protein kinase-like protein n=1 Tax=Heracleum sosnowskyi TaxID=360622 RepID=A0AAD8GL78_9APIA|nr:serine/threonine-protein kinase-like protein [Heracleum sosnowskyi]KAK1374256.1 serine/threonine-protein kinase-like protein [Heracleum sosnowskyi]